MGKQSRFVLNNNNNFNKLTIFYMQINNSIQFPQILNKNILPSQKIAKIYINNRESFPLTKQYLNKKIMRLSGQFDPFHQKFKNQEEKQKQQPANVNNLFGASVRKFQYKKISRSRKKKVSNYESFRENITQSAPKNNIRELVYSSKQVNTLKNIQSSNKPKYDIIMQQFLFIVNLSNNYYIQNKQAIYKAYVQKGNNGMLIKSILKKRWWWLILEDKQYQKCNFIWSEWYCREFSDKIPKLQSIQKLKLIQDDLEKKSTKYLNTLKVSAKTDIVNKKKQKINKVLNLDLFKKAALKISNQQQSYFIFNNKIRKYFLEYFTQTTCIHSQKPRIVISNQQAKLHNHLEGGLNLHSKKLLFLNLKKYYQSINKDPFQVIPLTFYIKNGKEDQEFLKLMDYFDRLELKKSNQNNLKQSEKTENIWICKPGQNSNRGNGISVVNKKEQLMNLVSILQNQNNSAYKRSLIIQKYLQNPFLIQKRKFDIRCYILLTSYNGVLKGYWYDEGYIRTTSQQFTLKNIENKMIHLTNDAIQKKGKQYGKFQTANKMSFFEFQTYLGSQMVNGKQIFKRSYEEIKKIGKQLILSVYEKINQKKKEFVFELFGLDFMLDSNLKPWLIEANSNPCLDTTGPLLSRLITELVQNVFKLAIDPIFPPPEQISRFKPKITSNYFQSNKFKLIFDEIQQVCMQKVDKSLVQ